MVSPYESIPGLDWIIYIVAALMLIASLLLIIGVWVFWSANKMLRAWGKIMSSKAAREWETVLTPPKDVLPNVAWFFVLAGINGVLIAGSLFIVGYVEPVN